MKKNIHPRVLLNTALIIPFIFCVYGLAVDVPVISEKFKMFYIVGRVCMATSFLIFLFQVNILKKQYESQVPMIFSIIILYCIQGQYLVNGYYLAFMQATAAFSLFFAMPKKYYFPITFFANILILLSIWMTIYVYSEDPVKTLKFKVDTSFGITLNSLLCFIGYLTITLSREQKQILSEKFLHVGRYFGNFAHELKSMLSSPTVYVELLSLELEKPAADTAYLKKIVKNLKADIYNVNDKILGINNLSKNSDDIASIHIQLLVDSIEKHFFSKYNLNISFAGEVSTVIANEYSLRSIFLNLLNNSKENFLIKKIAEKSIEIRIENQKIFFKDNGGGFSKNALKKTNQNSFFTEKELGSGMGLFLVKEYMREFSGSAFFRNRHDNVAGVEVVLIFQKMDI